MDHRASTGRQAGFTLIELMIAVAIIGVLASVAIPAFSRFQTTSKRAEAYANLAALAKHQKGYYSEHSVFIGALAEPLGLTGQPPGTEKRDTAGWDTTTFGQVGWQPEGDVFYDYDVNAFNIGCACAECFTAAAYGDLDGNGALSVMLYAQPDNLQAAWCQTALVPQDPPIGPSGNRLFNQVVRSQLSDLF